MASKSSIPSASNCFFQNKLSQDGGRQRLATGPKYPEIRLLPPLVLGGRSWFTHYAFREVASLSHKKKSMIYEHKRTLYNSDTWSVQFRRIWFWPLFFCRVCLRGIHPPSMAQYPNDTLASLVAGRPSRRECNSGKAWRGSFGSHLMGDVPTNPQKNCWPIRDSILKPETKAFFPSLEKEVWKSFALRIGFLAILELVESCRLCLFDSGSWNRFNTLNWQNM